ncbi:MAG: hypothetical protein JXR96_28370, partial [Deltaproteobacteria bacterium]|nr:hypothetical protein [Deltaproteobacteria bacterium]
IAMVEEADVESCSGPVVPFAEVSAETGETATADGGGYFELWAVPGHHLMGGEADGYLGGVMKCHVISDTTVRCCMGLMPGPDAEMGEWHDGQTDELSDEEPLMAPGCATAGSLPGGGLCLLLGLLLALRRRS